jgi:hypothetical protein
MSSMQDLYNSVITIAQTFNNFVNNIPAIGGNVTAVNNLSSGAFVQVIGPNQKRNIISFHNPGANVAYVAPLTTSNGQPLTPSFSALGGCFQVVPGDFVTLSKNVTGAYQAAVAAGSSQPLTVFDQ